MWGTDSDDWCCMPHRCLQSISALKSISCRCMLLDLGRLGQCQGDRIIWEEVGFAALLRCVKCGSRLSKPVCLCVCVYV